MEVIDVIDELVLILYTKAYVCLFIDISLEYLCYLKFEFSVILHIENVFDFSSYTDNKTLLQSFIGGENHQPVASHWPTYVITR